MSKIVNADNLKVSTLIASAKDPAWSPRQKEALAFVRVVPGKDPAWSPREKELVELFGGDDYQREEIWLADSQGEKPRKIADGAGPYGRATASRYSSTRRNEDYADQRRSAGQTRGTHRDAPNRDVYPQNMSVDRQELLHHANAEGHNSLALIVMGQNPLSAKRVFMSRSARENAPSSDRRRMEKYLAS